MKLWEFTFDGATVRVENHSGFKVGSIPLGNITATVNSEILEIEPAAYFVLTWEGGRYWVADDGTVVASCDTNPELVHCLQRLIGDAVVRNAKTVNFIHAASLIRLSDSRTVVLPGSSGCGNSTLARSLAEKGYEVCSDDVVALAPDGTMQPFETRRDRFRVDMLLFTIYGAERTWAVRELTADKTIEALNVASLGFDPETADQSTAVRHFQCLTECALAATAWSGVRGDAARCVDRVNELLDRCMVPARYPRRHAGA